MPSPPRSWKAQQRRGWKLDARRSVTCGWREESGRRAFSPGTGANGWRLRELRKVFFFFLLNFLLAGWDRSWEEEQIFIQKKHEKLVVSCICYIYNYLIISGHKCNSCEFLQFLGEDTSCTNKWLAFLIACCLCWWKELQRSPVEVGSWNPYVFLDPRWFYRRISEPSTVFHPERCRCRALMALDHRRWQWGGREREVFCGSDERQNLVGVVFWLNSVIMSPLKD